MKTKLVLLRAPLCCAVALGIAWSVGPAAAADSVRTGSHHDISAA
ncbi:MAG TPA: hypothetical protein VEL06_13415 [Haliangiales bacterium]|nr:hypothetical protein [Haliangiales bacterium]